MRAALMTAVVVLGLAGGDSVSAEPASQLSATTALAQADPPRRAPPRVIITPRQQGASPYPSRGAAFPGPGHVRECTSWLEPEARPSGTVIVPRMRCWWVRGRA
jgi:hypothetical protein